MMSYSEIVENAPFIGWAHPPDALVNSRKLAKYLADLVSEAKLGNGPDGRLPLTWQNDLEASIAILLRCDTRRGEQPESLVEYLSPSNPVRAEPCWSRVVKPAIRKACGSYKSLVQSPWNEHFDIDASNTKKKLEAEAKKALNARFVATEATNKLIASNQDLRKESLEASQGKKSTKNGIREPQKSQKKKKAHSVVQDEVNDTIILRRGTVALNKAAPVGEGYRSGGKGSYVSYVKDENGNVCRKKRECKKFAQRKGEDIANVIEDLYLYVDRNDQVNLSKSDLFGVVTCMFPRHRKNVEAATIRSMLRNISDGGENLYSADWFNYQIVGSALHYAPKILGGKTAINFGHKLNPGDNPNIVGDETLSIKVIGIVMRYLAGMLNKLEIRKMLGANFGRLLEMLIPVGSMGDWHNHQPQVIKELAECDFFSDKGFRECTVIQRSGFIKRFFALLIRFADKAASVGQLFNMFLFSTPTDQLDQDMHAAFIDLMIDVINIACEIKFQHKGHMFSRVISAKNVEQARLDRVMLETVVQSCHGADLSHDDKVEIQTRLFEHLSKLSGLHEKKFTYSDIFYWFLMEEIPIVRSLSSLAMDFIQTGEGKLLQELPPQRLFFEYVKLMEASVSFENHELFVEAVVKNAEYKGKTFRTRYLASSDKLLGGGPTSRITNSFASVDAATGNLSFLSEGAFDDLAVLPLNVQMACSMPVFGMDFVVVSTLDKAQTWYFELQDCDFFEVVDSFCSANDYSLVINQVLYTAVAAIGFTISGQQSSARAGAEDPESPYESVPKVPRYSGKELKLRGGGIDLLALDAAYDDLDDYLFDENIEVPERLLGGTGGKKKRKRALTPKAREARRRRNKRRRERRRAKGKGKGDYGGFFTGHGDYKSKAKRAGGNLMKSVGRSAVKRLRQELISSLATGVTGAGDYAGAASSELYGGSVGNSMMKGVRHKELSEFHAQKRNYVSFTYDEYLGDIYGPAAGNYFQNLVYQFNPGLSATFPVTSQLASNFQEYRVKQLIFHFKCGTTPYGSSNGQTGILVMAFNVNPLEQPFQDKTSIEDYRGSVSFLPTQDGYLGVECDGNLGRAGEWRYTRTTNLQLANGLNSMSLENFDLGTFQMCLCNVPSAQAGLTLGELRCYLTIEFRNIKLTMYKGMSIQYQQWNKLNATTYPSTPMYVGNAASLVSEYYSNLGANLSTSSGGTLITLTMPPESAGGYKLTFCMSFSGTTAQTIPAITVTLGGTLRSYNIFGDKATVQTSYAGATATNTIVWMLETAFIASTAAGGVNNTLTLNFSALSVQTAALNYATCRVEQINPGLYPAGSLQSYINLSSQVVLYAGAGN